MQYCRRLRIIRSALYHDPVWRVCVRVILLLGTYNIILLRVLQNYRVTRDDAGKGWAARRGGEKKKLNHNKTRLGHSEKLKTLTHLLVRSCSYIIHYTYLRVT